MTMPTPTVPTTAAGRRADRRAEACLLAATAVGALLALGWHATEDPPFGLTFVGVELIWAAVPALLILTAYLLTAADERRSGLRQQRGALAALTGLAVFAVPFTVGIGFSPVYGLALLALAVRTRGPLTAATGVLALAVALSAGPLTALQNMVALALVVVAGGIAAVRTWREATADSSHEIPPAGPRTR